jgi:DNA helicase MCM9
MQELFTSVKPGHIPKAITLILENNLTDTCLPGDDVKIYGVLIHRWMFNPFPNSRPELQLCIYVNAVQVLNKTDKVNSDVTPREAKEFQKFWSTSSPISSRNLLIDSIAPMLYGRSDEKLGLLLSLIGGVPIPGRDSVRGKVHVLFVGDPGTGKSQLLRYACKVVGRSVMTSGVATTGAGLTV